ncbi:MAG: ferrous iron transport protein B [Bacteroidaceae bacterium]|nr:ferrous iron transport protein B [Bacteroidaceae bacterium]
MRLSELKTGEKGIIVRVMGHGGFRKRIVEMGFIRGKSVEVLLNAPLHDPVKYKIMDYEVSLRRAEAELVEVVSEKEVRNWEAPQSALSGMPVDGCDDLMQRMALAKGHELQVVLVGNPNCGKTSLFNIAGKAHERVGNYSGVTVDAKTGQLEFEGYHFNIVDLPGTYSLSAYTPEELYVRKYIIEQHPDLIINVVDASNLERNLYLTTQLIDMDVPMIMALNMYDELRQSGNRLDIDQLGTLLGVPVVPTVGKTGEGVSELFHQIIEIVEGRQKTARHIHINHGTLLEDKISRVEELIRVNPEPHQNYSARFLAIKLLENDHQVESIVHQLDNAAAILDMRDQCQREIKDEINEDSESAITDAKYGFVQGAVKETFKKVHIFKRQMTEHIDAVVTHRIWGYPIFLALMYLMFFCTFNIGQYPMDWIDAAVKWLGEAVGRWMTDGPLKDLIIDGIISGVGGVIVFLPNIMILYAFISWMEDSGYMARAAFIMDKIMHRMGLHGKSFIPMIMGFGCNIPAIMATRTIEDRKSRLITMLIIPLMSCSARLPVYIIIIGAFFPHNAALVLFALYLIGILMSILMANLFSRFVVKGESTPFVMELPPYRTPSAFSVTRHTWEKGKQYLKKMGTTILLASIVVWALSYFPHNDQLPQEQQLEQSYIGKMGKLVEPVLAPCGLQWKEGVALITGVGAKEIVASTMAVLYHGQLSPLSPEISQSEVNSQSSMVNGQWSTVNGQFSSLGAFSFLIFVLLYMPCIPSCIAIRHESGRWRWAFFTAAYTTCLAWVSSMLVFQIGSLF